MLHDLDLKYRHTVHGCDLLVKDEETRRMKLRSMLSRDEASSLKEQLAQRDVRVKELVDQVDDARSQLDSLRERCRRQDLLMKTQAREIANLKVGQYIGKRVIFSVVSDIIPAGRVVCVQRRVAGLCQDLVRETRPLS